MIATSANEVPRPGSAAHSLRPISGFGRSRPTSCGRPPGRSAMIRQTSEVITQQRIGPHVKNPTPARLVCRVSQCATRQEVVNGSGRPAGNSTTWVPQSSSNTARASAEPGCRSRRPSRGGAERVTTGWLAAARCTGSGRAGEDQLGRDATPQVVGVEHRAEAAVGGLPVAEHQDLAGDQSSGRSAAQGPAPARTSRRLLKSFTAA